MPLLALFLISGFSSTLHAASITGPVERLNDGDTFQIWGQRIRLKGIDAPEISQSCSDQSSVSYLCGVAATDHLRSLIGGAEVTCIGDEKDDYGRLIAVCRSGAVNLNRRMVADGWAVAYRRYDTSYVSDEISAQTRQSGIWRGVFERPWRYRQAEWRDARKVAAKKANPQQPGKECLIKGNINGKGDRIYHTPWGSKHYQRTKISTRHGERWFCTEGEAVAAGWRAPYN